MKKPPVALAVTGKVMRSFILDLPGFRERIGPIKASSLRVASRIANTLRAGHAVADAAAFEGSRMVLLCVPDEDLAATVADLADASLDWAGKTVVLCDSPQSSESLRRLAARGAYTASIDLAPGARMLVVDGHRRAISELKPLVGRTGRMVRVEENQRARFYHGMATARLCGSLAAIAGEHLKASGLSPAQAKPIVQTILLDAVRDYVKSGSKVLSNGTDAPGAEILARVLHAVNQG